jgi:hypothetical protein
MRRDARQSRPEGYAGGHERGADDVGFPLAAAEGGGLGVGDDFILEGTLEVDRSC